MENLIMFTEKLESDNPELIFLNNLENNLNSNDKSELGLISIFKDYSNKIGFKIRKVQDQVLTKFINIQIEDKQFILN